VLWAVKPDDPRHRQQDDWDQQEGGDKGACRLAQIDRDERPQHCTDDERYGPRKITVDGKHVGYERMPGGGFRPVRNLAQARAAARIGMVFQHFNLFEHLTALENLIEAPIRSDVAFARSALEGLPFRLPLRLQLAFELV